MKDPLYIIDTTSPFFLQHKSKMINWSKVPYYHLEKNGNFHKDIFPELFKNYKKYIKKISNVGFNSISIDDLCHITLFDFYPDALKKKINRYRNRFLKFIKYAKEFNLKTFITTDIMFFNKYIKRFTGKNDGKILFLLNLAIESLFRDFEGVDGVIFRIGESDGVDTEDDFASRIIIKNPEQANNYIKELLPVFERNRKYLIFRTWCLGAYKIGDLIWNESTFKKTFKEIKSPYFIISLKYGEGDFFKYLELNKLFFADDNKKIIELQTRREYEGFGEFPSFVGWDYKEIYDKLKDNSSVVGMHVWCNTGGWSGFKNYTFLKKASIWNEINTFVTLKIFKDDYSVEDAIKIYYNKNKEYKLFLRFLMLSEEVIKGLLYDPGFASCPLYFNKVRIPPILHIFWDNITVTDVVIEFYNLFNENKNQSIQCIYNAMLNIKEMKAIGGRLKISYNNKFYFDTFKLIGLCRLLIYNESREWLIKKIKQKIKKYKKNYKRGFKFHIHVTKRSKNIIFRNFLKIAVRKDKKYRFVDKILFNYFSSRIILLLYKLVKSNFPNFSDSLSMPVETFLK